MLVRTEGHGTLPTYGPLVFQFSTHSGQPCKAASADFNCDGKIDVVLIQQIFQSPTLFPIRIIGNNGSGAMIDISSQVITGTPPTVAACPGKRWSMISTAMAGLTYSWSTSAAISHRFQARQNQLLLSTSDCHLVSATTTHLPQQIDASHSTAAARHRCRRRSRSVHLAATFGAAVADRSADPGNGRERRYLAGSPSRPVACRRRSRSHVPGSRTRAQGFADVDRDGDPDLLFGADDIESE